MDVNKVYYFRGIGYDFKNMHTKQLLNLKTFGFNYTCPCCDMYVDEDGEYHMKYPSEYYEIRKAIYEELSKREHVLNKVESKMIRKEKKLKGRKKLEYVR